MTDWRHAVRRAVPKPLLWKIAPMRLVWYQFDENRTNFGDELGPLIIQSLFGVDVKGRSVPDADMISIGSLFEVVEKQVSDLKPYIWGTGFIQDGPIYRGRNIRIRAVRGKLTFDRVRHIAPTRTAIGDPGLLATIAFPSLVNVEKKYRISVVPHYKDQDHPEISFAAEAGIHVIDVLDPPLKVVQEIAESEIVFSSSLHGLVVADSFGVPNYWTPLSTKVEGSGYKFRDYYSAFSTSPSPLRLDDAIKRAAERQEDWKPLPGLADIQEALIRSFPAPRMSRKL